MKGYNDISWKMPDPDPKLPSVCVRRLVEKTTRVGDIQGRRGCNLLGVRYLLYRGGVGREPSHCSQQACN